MSRFFRTCHLSPLVLILLAVLLSACQTTAPTPATPKRSLEGLDASAWMNSAEAIADSLGTWRIAHRQLDAALADSSWTAALEQEGSDYSRLPPAVIVDVDETVLDNAPFQTELIRTGGSYNSENWDVWVRKESAKPLPGALEFCKAAASKGVTMYYVTNRRDHQAEATQRNLEAEGFPVGPGTVLGRGSSSDKTARREIVASTHRILLLLGDNLGDFVGGTKAAPAERKALAMKYADRWGVSWLMLPNPTYGDWASAPFGFRYDLPAEEKLEKRLLELP